VLCHVPCPQGLYLCEEVVVAYLIFYENVCAHLTLLTTLLMIFKAIDLRLGDLS
jgi:hypothetical protein